MFLGRTHELQQLERRYAQDNFQCMVIYGRRRVGKTALINEFCKNKKTIFFSALEATAGENLVALSDAIHAYKEQTIGSGPVYANYDRAFEEITRIGNQEQIVFVIDEFPYLAKSYSSISSRLQHLIDHKWQNSKIYLILCGSSMSFMENQVLGYESPLYGRRTGQLKIQPLSYKDITAFYPKLSYSEQALLYGITGGIPHYINKLQVTSTLEEALIENFFDNSAYLFEEPNNLLKQELREPAVYNTIITAIAEGASRINEIATKANLPTSACTKYINVLIELGILRKETPITEKPGRKTIYQIADNFFRFWYRFVPQNYSAINTGRIPELYKLTVQPYLSTYMGLVYEEMCKTYLLRYAENLPIPLADVGQWWGTDKQAKKEVQIDIVGTPAIGNEYIIGSCKFKNEKIGVDELEIIKHYASVFGRGNKYHYYIFSKSGFTQELLDCEKMGKVHLVDLPALYQ